MYIKRLDNHEILDAFHLTWNIFEDEGMQYYTEEGIQAFREFILYDKAMNRVRAGEIIVFGAINGQEMCGVSVISRTGQIQFIVVKKEYRGHGIAKGLEQCMYQYCQGNPEIKKMKIYCIPQFAEFSRHMGFTSTHAEMSRDGMRFIELEKFIQPPLPTVKQEHKSNKGIFIAVCMILAILIAILAFLAGKIKTLNGLESKEDAINPNKGGAAIIEQLPQETEEETEKADQAVGLDGVESYVEEELPYTIEEENYVYNSGASKGEYPIEFDVKYPQIRSEELDNLDRINSLLKECAMISVNTLYLEPGHDVKNSILKEKEPFLGSNVTYKVTYAGNDFISVAFSDNYYVGNVNRGYVDLRTRNIRLSDGKVFETSEIVDLSTDFMHVWLDKMKKEAPKAKVLEELYISDFRDILNGRMPQNRYYDNFFFDADGIEIGMTYHHKGESGQEDKGWITAPFTLDEIMQYKTDSEVWKLVKSVD